MTQISEEEIRKTSIRFPDGNKLLVTVYSNKNAELYLRMLRDHENLMTQNGSKKDIEDAHAHVDLRKTFKEYKTANAVVNAAQKKLCRDIATAAFSLFRRLGVC